MSVKRMRVEYLARVEGEGGLQVKVRDGQVEELTLNIFEPPRFFQGILLGRSFTEVADFTSRICGICPVAYQMCALMAIERAIGLQVSPTTRELRKLFSLSQWIQSHSLHIYLLALPDLLGFPSAVELSEADPEAVMRGLRLKQLGNDLTALIGGRAVHPVTAVVGGFTWIPSQKEMDEMRDRLLRALDDALETVRLVAGLKLPGFEHQTEYVALMDQDGYGVNQGRWISDRGLDIDAADYREHIHEFQVAHSNAMHSIRRGGGPFMVGPLARVNLGFDRLSPVAKAAAAGAGWRFPAHGSFRAIQARALELVHAIAESAAILDGIDLKDTAIPPFRPRAGEGAAMTEAPRGTLYHRYRLNDQGLVEFADIVAPTSHNLHQIEDEMRAFIPTVIDLPDDRLALECEMLVRNYDPCISCATHFLNVRIERC